MTTVGEILQKKRLEKGLTLFDIEKKIKVREKYLKAIEQNDWNFFSSKIYIVGVIKNYARFLGIDVNKILAFFRRDYEKKEEIKFKKSVSQKYLTSETKQILKISFIGLIIFFLVYFSYQLILFFSPPKLIIISPKTNVFIRESKINIIGKTDKEVSITIAGQRVYQDKDGIFQYDFPLKNGNNILKIELIGANGKKSIIEKKYLKKTLP